MKKVLKPVRGFTLVEVMVVIIIIGVLAALAIPIYNSYTNRAKAAEAKNILSFFASNANMWQVQYGSYNNGAVPDLQCRSSIQASSKYFNGANQYTPTATGYWVRFDAGPAGAPFVSVKLTHVDGLKDVVTVTPSNLPDIGTGW
jgi:prepilin-type N-terminal cleavage/methylation domain-containing protein